MTVDHLLSFTENEKRKIMKWLVLLAFVAIAAAYWPPQKVLVTVMAVVFDLTVDDVQNCFNTSRITFEDLMFAGNSTTSNRGPSDNRFYKISCFSACFANKQGIMDGMKLNVPMVIDYYVRRKVSMPLQKLKMFRDVLNLCNEEVTETNDECNAIYQLHECIKNRKGLHLRPIIAGFPFYPEPSFL
ncbi:uncharacterized protein LOC143174358 isoform X1 [Nomia melanderi]|uniref:uncharacterized protein LOC143174358 isoform X1 n=1 Tax=Nomia melanderi TaxID=2448451 RepID=UPI003FCC3FC8